MEITAKVKLDHCRTLKVWVSRLAACFFLMHASFYWSPGPPHLLTQNMLAHKDDLAQIND